MAPKIQHKRSSTASNPPTDTQLDPGEIALNTNATTANLHFKDAGNTVRSIGSDPLTAGSYVRTVAANGDVGTWTDATSAVSVDLGYTAAATQGTVTNTAGTDATLPFATSSDAGLFIEAATPGTATTQYARQVTTGGVATWAQVAIPPGTIVDSTEPGSPADGQLWFNTTAGNNTLWVWDADGSTWNPAVPQVPDGGGGDYADGEVRERVFFNNEQQIDEDYTVSATTNSGSFGPITVDAAATVTVANGGTWTVCGGAGQSIDIEGFWSRDSATTTLSPATAGDSVAVTGQIRVGSGAAAGDESDPDAAGARIGGSGAVTLKRAQGSSSSIPLKLVWGTTTSFSVTNNGIASFCGSLDYPVAFNSVGTLEIGDTGSDGGANDGTFYSRVGPIVFKNNAYQGNSTSSTNNFIVGQSSAAANQQRTVKFCVNNSGRIRSAASTSINQITSERRLKTNIEPIDPDASWRTIRDLPYYSYNWKSSPDCPEKTHGPMADEVPAEMLQNTYVEDENGNDVIRMDAEGPIRTYDNDMLQARLFVALQTALKRIEALEAEVNTLKGGSN